MIPREELIEATATAGPSGEVLVVILIVTVAALGLAWAGIVLAIIGWSRQDDGDG